MPCDSWAGTLHTKLSASLNYEEPPFLYHVYIRAKDDPTSGDPHAVVFGLEISLEDRNDPPVFVAPALLEVPGMSVLVLICFSISCSASEDMSPGELSQLIATDEDRDELTFSLEVTHCVSPGTLRGTIDNPFELDAKGGLFVFRGLDFETCSRYDLSITVSDLLNNTNPRTTTVVIAVMVLDRDDPSISFFSSALGAVPENGVNLESAFAFSITDQDTGEVGASVTVRAVAFEFTPFVDLRDARRYDLDWNPTFPRYPTAVEVVEDVLLSNLSSTRWPGEQELESLLFTFSIAEDRLQSDYTNFYYSGASHPCGNYSTDVLKSLKKLQRVIMEANTTLKLLNSSCEEVLYSPSSFVFGVWRDERGDVNATQAYQSFFRRNIPDNDTFVWLCSTRTVAYPPQVETAWHDSLWNALTIIGLNHSDLKLCFPPSAPEEPFISEWGEVPRCPKGIFIRFRAQFYCLYPLKGEESVRYGTLVEIENREFVVTRSQAHATYLTESGWYGSPVLMGEEILSPNGPVSRMVELSPHQLPKWKNKSYSCLTEGLTNVGSPTHFECHDPSYDVMEEEWPWLSLSNMQDPQLPYYWTPSEHQPHSMIGFESCFDHLFTTYGSSPFSVYPTKKTYFESVREKQGAVDFLETYSAWNRYLAFEVSPQHYNSLLSLNESVILADTSFRTHEIEASLYFIEFIAGEARYSEIEGNLTSYFLTMLLLDVNDPPTLICCEEIHMEGK